MEDRGEPILSFSNAQEMEAHLVSPSMQAKGFWLKLSKAGAPKSLLSKDEAVQAALCCGWIDGQLKKLDEQYYLVWMTPRRPGSLWSRKNRKTAVRLIEERRMRPQGLAEIEAAQNDGRWANAYASQGKADIPSDLIAALEQDPEANRFFDTLDRANRYAIIYRVNTATKPETRAKRVFTLVKMLARQETIHPVRKKAKTEN